MKFEVGNQTYDTKLDFSSSGRDPQVLVSEIFGPTIQGEGPLIGAPTHFLRLAGCDYKCTMCDSMHAVDPKHLNWNPTLMRCSEITQCLIDLGNATQVRRLTISGGNPGIHPKLAFVIQRLRVVHEWDTWDIWVETQGTHYPEWFNNLNGIVVSPKTKGMGEKFDRLAYNEFLNRCSMALRANPSLKVYVKIVCFTKEDIEQAMDIFNVTQLEDAEFFISLGNPNFDEPTIDQREYMATYRERVEQLMDVYRERPSISPVRILPQLHVLTWQNELGR